MRRPSVPSNLRPFRAADLPVLRAWLDAAGFDAPVGLSEPRWVDRICNDPRILCRVIEDEDGCVRGFHRLDLAPDQSAEITLVTDPARRRCGFGRRLLEDALAEARRRGLRLLYAVVEDGNRGGHAFFVRAGFKPSGQHVPGYVHLHRIVHNADSLPPLEIVP